MSPTGPRPTLYPTVVGSTPQPSSSVAPTAFTTFSPTITTWAPTSVNQPFKIVTLQGSLVLEYTNAVLSNADYIALINTFAQILQTPAEYVTIPRNPPISEITRRLVNSNANHKRLRAGTYEIMLTFTVKLSSLNYIQQNNNDDTDRNVEATLMMYRTEATNR